MTFPIRAIRKLIYAFMSGALLSASPAHAADSVVRIFGVGQGFVVPPGAPFQIQYQVLPESNANHLYYLNNALALTKPASQVQRAASGAYTITYPYAMAQDQLLDLRICISTTPAQICDEVSIRAGQILEPAQTIEISPSGFDGYLPAQTSFQIAYTILKPTLLDQLFYTDDQLRGRKSSSSPLSGLQSVKYPGALAVGESSTLRFCLDDYSADSACGFAQVTGGPAPDGIDLPEEFNADDLPSHFQTVADCNPVCGYYANIYYGDPAVSWIPERGDGMPDGLRMDIYTSHAGGLLDPAATPSTLVIYAHSAGSNKESLINDKKSLLRHLISIGDTGAGVMIASLDFRHPLKQLESDLTPSSTRDLDYAIQFAREYASQLNINPDDIFLVGSSLGGGAAVHAAVRDIANPDDPAPIRRQSSSVRGVFTNNAQTSFAPQWFRDQFLEPDVAATYGRDLLNDEQRLIYGHAPARVNGNSPRMELLFTSPFVDHKVTLEEYRGKTVDVTHLPNYGLAMEAQYKMHGIGDRIRVIERYAGNFSSDSAKFISQHRLGRE